MKYITLAVNRNKYKEIVDVCVSLSKRVIPCTANQFIVTNNFTRYLNKQYAKELKNFKLLRIPKSYAWFNDVFNEIQQERNIDGAQAIYINNLLLVMLGYQTSKDGLMLSLPNKSTLSALLHEYTHLCITTLAIKHNKFLSLTAEHSEQNKQIFKDVKALSYGHEDKFKQLYSRLISYVFDVDCSPQNIDEAGAVMWKKLK
jgi:hypothetical protein